MCLQKYNFCEVKNGSEKCDFSEGKNVIKNDRQKWSLLRGQKCYRNSIEKYHFSRIKKWALQESPPGDPSVVSQSDPGNT